MVIHVVLNITQEASCNDTDSTEGDAGVVDIHIASRISLLTSQDDHVVGSLVGANSGDGLQEGQEGSSGVGDGIRDVSGIGDTELKLHDATDVLDGIGDELGDEDVVIDAVSDGTTNDTNGERECSDGGNEVVGADDGGHDGSWDNNAADAEAGKDEDPPKFVEIEPIRHRESSAAYERVGSVYVFRSGLVRSDES